MRKQNRANPCSTRLLLWVTGVVHLVFLASAQAGAPPGKSTKPFTVVIDAGHGGHDPGCHGTRFHEKDVALGIALKLGNYIEKHCADVRVVYTRKTDVFLELNERARVANDADADLFLCIHCNASPNKKVFGSETYVMGLHKTKGNLEVAKRENSAILLEDNYQKNYENFDPNSDEATIIFTMYQNAFLDKSLSLASKIQDAYKGRACRTDKGVKQAGFLVLWKTSMPSLLTETGFLTNPREERYLGSEKGQDQMAHALFLAFRKYKDEFIGQKRAYDDELERRQPCQGIAEIAEPAEEQLAGDSSLSDVQTQDTTKALTPEQARILFSVQMYSSPKALPVNSERFSGMSDVWRVQQEGMYKYLTGHFKELHEALEEQNRLRGHGFKDAFVVAFEGEKRITIKEAMQKLKH
jgi:N-acetylmuramoyl-L-alanine amidase